MRAFDGVAADAWFRIEQDERDGMPLELLERDQVLAVVMPGKPGGGGDEIAPEEESEEEEESEGEPS